MLKVAIRDRNNCDGFLSVHINTPEMFFLTFVLSLIRELRLSDFLRDDQLARYMDLL